MQPTEELYMTSTQADQDRLERYRVLGVLRALTPDKGAYKKAKAMAMKKLQEFQKDDAKTMGFVHKPFDATGHKKLEAKLLVTEQERHEAGSEGEKGVREKAGEAAGVDQELPLTLILTLRVC